MDPGAEGLRVRRSAPGGPRRALRTRHGVPGLLDRSRVDQQRHHVFGRRHRRSHRRTGRVHRPGTRRDPGCRAPRCRPRSPRRRSDGRTRRRGHGEGGRRSTRRGGTALRGCPGRDGRHRGRGHRREPGGATARVGALGADRTLPARRWSSSRSTTYSIADTPAWLPRSVLPGCAPGCRVHLPPPRRRLPSSRARRCR